MSKKLPKKIEKIIDEAHAILEEHIEIARYPTPVRVHKVIGNMIMVEVLPFEDAAQYYLEDDPEKDISGYMIPTDVFAEASPQLLKATAVCAQRAAEKRAERSKQIDDSIRGFTGKEPEETNIREDSVSKTKIDAECMNNPFDVRVVRCTVTDARCWYHEYIGEIITVVRSLEDETVLIVYDDIIEKEGVARAILAEDCEILVEECDA